MKAVRYAAYGRGAVVALAAAALAAVASVIDGAFVKARPLARQPLNGGCR